MCSALWARPADRGMIEKRAFLKCYDFTYLFFRGVCVWLRFLLPGYDNLASVYDQLDSLEPDYRHNDYISVYRQVFSNLTLNTTYETSRFCQSFLILCVYFFHSKLWSFPIGYATQRIDNAKKAKLQLVWQWWSFGQIKICYKVTKILAFCKEGQKFATKLSVVWRPSCWTVNYKLINK